MRKLALGVVLFGLVAAPAQAADFATRLRAAEPCGAAEVPLVVAERAGRQRRDPARDRPDGRRRVRRRGDRRRAPQRQAAARPRRPRLGHPGVVDAVAGRARAGQGARDDDRPHRRPVVAGRGPEHHARQRRRDQGAGLRAATVAAGRPSAARRRSPSSRPRRAATQKKLLYVQAAKVTDRRRPADDGVHARRPTVQNVPTGRRRHRQLDRARRRQLDPDLLLGARLRPEARGQRAHDARLVRDRPLQPDRHEGDHRLLGRSTSSRPTIRSLLKDAGGALFEDSLELETDSALWTPGFADAFEQQLGYALLPVPAAGGQERREGRLQLSTRRRSRPRPARRQPRPDQPLQREPPQAAEGVGERARPQAARPAVRPADRRDAGVARCSTSPRASRSASRTSTTTSARPARATWRATRSSPTRRARPPAAPTARPGRPSCASSRPSSPRASTRTSSTASPTRRRRSARWPGFSAFSPLNNVAGLRRVVGPAPADVEARVGHQRLLRAQPGGDADRPQHRSTPRVLIQTGYVAAGYGAPFFTADTREAAQVLKDGGNHVGWTQRDDQRVDPRPARTRSCATGGSRRTARTSRRSCSRATSPSAARSSCASRRRRSCSTGRRPGCRS